MSVENGKQEKKGSGYTSERLAELITQILPEGEKVEYYNAFNQDGKSDLLFSPEPFGLCVPMPMALCARGLANLLSKNAWHMLYNPSEMPTLERGWTIYQQLPSDTHPKVVVALATWVKDDR